MPAARRMAPADRRAHLVDAALRLFADRPEDEVGLEDLAAAAGVTRNLLYRYFDSRADLQRAAVGEAIARVATRFDDDPDVPVVEKLPRNVALWFDVEDPAVRLVLRARHFPDREVTALLAGARGALCVAIARNHLGEHDPSPELLAVLDGYLTLAQQLMEGGVLGRAQIERVLIDALPVMIRAVE